MTRDLLVGRRAIYTQVTYKYDETTKKSVEVSRDSFGGTIAALITRGDSSQPAIVMLYDDGSLQTHCISTITVQPECTQGPYR